MKKWRGFLILLCAVFLCACGSSNIAQLQDELDALEKQNQELKDTLADLRGEENITQAPGKEPGVAPTKEPEATPTPFPEEEEPGTEYAVTGPNGENFKINVDENGKMLVQRYYDENGVRIGRNEVTYNNLGQLAYIKCYNNEEEYIGLVDVQYYQYTDTPVKYMQSITALEHAIKVVLSVSIAEDGSVTAEFADADARIMKMYVYQMDGSVAQYAIIKNNEKGQPESGVAYDASGMMIAEMKSEIEIAEDGSEWQHQYTYSNGTLQSHVAYQYDERGNQASYISYNADGTVDYARYSENVYYEDGTWESFTKDTEGQIVSSELHDTDGNRLKYVSYTYDENGVETNRNEREYYANGTQKSSSRYENGMLQNQATYDEKGNQLDSIYRNSDWRTGETTGYTKRVYESGIETSTIEYDKDWNMLSQSFIERDENGNVTKRVKIDINGVEVSRDEYEYFADGRRKTEVHYTENGEFWYRYDYKEDGSGYVSTHHYYNGNTGEFAGYYEEEYNKEGSVVEYRDYGVDGTLNGRTVYEYYEDGRTKKSAARYNRKGEEISYSLYNEKGQITECKREPNVFPTDCDYYFEKFDEEERVVSRERYDENDKLVGWETFVYSIDGLEMTETEYDAEGNKLYWLDVVFYPDGADRMRTRYDVNGRLEWIGRYSKDGVNSEVTSYDYDSSGQITSYDVTYYENGGYYVRVSKHEKYDADGKFQSGEENSYDENNDLVEVKRYGSDKKIESLVEYHAEGGHTVTKYSYNSKGELTGYEVTVYDAEGYETNRTKYDAQGKVIK